MLEARLPVTPVPGLSALRLHLATEKSGLSRLLRELNGSYAPYWAHVWAGGLALALQIAKEPAWVRDRFVIDYGSGSGLVAIAAAKAGAVSVVACDIDPLALEATRINAALNGVVVQTRLLNADSPGDVVLSRFQDQTAPKPAIVLAGDVFYDSKIADQTRATLEAFQTAGAEVLIGDPFRTHLPLSALSLIAHHNVTDFASGATQVPAGVFRLRRASTACS